MRINELTGQIIACGINVHRELGPGLLESAYEACLVYEPAERGLEIERQKAMPLLYKGNRLDCGYRIDLLVNQQVIVELKAVERLEPIHTAIVIHYLKLSGCKVGLLMNFQVKVMLKGIKRVVLGLAEDAPRVQRALR